MVLERGYSAATFVDGPLAEALRAGSLLYVEETNRIPEETLNVLITVMSEGELHVPRLGRIPAAEGFRLVAAMNPFDSVGTARISSAIYDRVCRITMGYQDAGDEFDIVLIRAPKVAAAWRSKVVELVRRTREHPDIRIGSSVRGAIDMTRLTVALATGAACPRTTGTPVWTLPWWRSPAGSGCRRPPARTPSRSSGSSTSRSSARSPSTQLTPPSGGDASGGA